MAAFGFFGGCPRRLVPDNLGTGVTKADLYDPKINRAYGELAAHYGCLVDPSEHCQKVLVAPVPATPARP